MTKRYIFNGEEGNAFIANSLVPYLGAIAFHNNYQEILKGIYEGIVCYHVDYPTQHLVSLIEDYGVPREQAADIISGVRILLSRHVMGIMGTNIGERIYDVEVYSTYDVHIVDVGSVEDYERKLTPPEDQFKRYIQDSLANGDWVSENLRRISGV